MGLWGQMLSQLRLRRFFFCNFDRALNKNFNSLLCCIFSLISVFVMQDLWASDASNISGASNISNAPDVNAQDSTGSDIYNDQVLNDGIFIALKLGANKVHSPDENMLNAQNPSYQRYKPMIGANLGYLYFDTSYLFTGVQLGADYFSEKSYKGSFEELGSSQVKILQYDFDMLFDVGLTTPVGLNLIGKLGVARVTQRFDGRNSGSEISFTGRTQLTRYQPKAEIDVGYICNSNTDLVLAYSHIFGQSPNHFPVDNNKILSNDAITVTVNYVLPE